MRNLRVEGRTIAAGDGVCLAPLVAAGVLGTGRAELVREGDRSIIDAAVRAENERVTRSELDRNLRRGRFVG